MKLLEKKIQELHLNTALTGNVVVSITGKDSEKVIWRDEFVVDKGISAIFPQLKLGAYTIHIEANGQTETQDLQVVTQQELDAEQMQLDFWDNNKPKVTGVVEGFFTDNIIPRIEEAKTLLTAKIGDSQENTNKKIDTISTSLSQEVKNLGSELSGKFSLSDSALESKIEKIASTLGQDITKGKELSSKETDDIKKTVSAIQKKTDMFAKSIPSGGILNYEVDDTKETKKNLWSAFKIKERGKTLGGGSRSAASVRGMIFGNISDQTDLQTALNAKVTKVGTPADNQIAVWTEDGTIEGNNNFTWDGSKQYLFNTTDAASNQMLVLEGDRATPTDGDEVYISGILSNIGGQQLEMARISLRGKDLAITSFADGAIDFSVRGVIGGLTKRVTLSKLDFSPSNPLDGGQVSLGTTSSQWAGIFLTPSTGFVRGAALAQIIYDSPTDRINFIGATGGYSFDKPVIPSANDATSLGTTAKQWSDLFLAEGGVINRDNGDVTLTQTGNTLNLAGGNFVVDAPVRLMGYTVATLPAGTIGDTAYVTDALAPAFGVAVAGTGAVVIPVFFDGTNRIVG